MVGSVQDQVANETTGQNSYAYGAWGEVRAQSVTIPNIYGYTGREFAEEGLYYYRARYMDSRVGRFVSEDPFRIIDSSDSINRHIYANDSPIDNLDPFGLFSINPSCKCSQYNIDNIRAGIRIHCRNLMGNKQCIDTIDKIGGKELLNCMKDNCQPGKKPRIECVDWLPEDCGGRKGSNLVFYMGRNGSKGLGRCGSPAHTIGEESFHTCYGSYWGTPEDEDKAELIGKACSMRGFFK